MVKKNLRNKEIVELGVEDSFLKESPTGVQKARNRHLTGSKAKNNPKKESNFLESIINRTVSEDEVVLTRPNIQKDIPEVFDQNFKKDNSVYSSEKLEPSIISDKVGVGVDSLDKTEEFFKTKDSDALEKASTSVKEDQYLMKIASFGARNSENIEKSHYYSNVYNLQKINKIVFFLVGLIVFIFITYFLYTFIKLDKKSEDIVEILKNNVSLPENAVFTVYKVQDMNSPLLKNPLFKDVSVGDTIFYSENSFKVIVFRESENKIVSVFSVQTN